MDNIHDNYIAILCHLRNEYIYKGDEYLSKMENSELKEEKEYCEIKCTEYFGIAEGLAKAIKIYKKYKE